MKYGKLKRAAGILLSVTLMLGSLTGCSKKESGSAKEAEGANTGENSGGGSGGEQAMGRFLEEDVALPIVFGNIYDMKKLEDGTIRIIGKNADDNLETVWDSKDSGDTWEKAFDGPKELQDEGNGYTDYAALSSDGQSVWVYNQIGDGGIQTILYLLDREGNLSRIPFELPAAEQGGSGSAQSVSIDVPLEDEGGEKDPDAQETENDSAGSQEPESGGEADEDKGPDASRISNIITNICFLGNDQILATDMSDKIFQINITDGSVPQTYDFSGTEDTHQVYAAGNKMIVVTSTEALLYDTETGEQQQKEEALQQSVAESGFFNGVDTIDAGESIYYLTEKGLYHYKFGGSVMEQLIDGTMNSLGAPAFYPAALTMLDEQNLLVAANDTNSASGAGMTVLKYTWSADTPAKPEKELKVYSLYNNRELRQAVSSFQKEHAEIYVNYQAAMSEENGTTVSDALKTLTTEIMAGKGPDLMILDGMPVETYIEKGILTDMSSLLEDKSGYFENILKAYEDEQGQLCAIPARFMIPAAQGSSAYYTPGEDFETFTGKKGILAHMDPEEALEKFWYSCGASWKKEDKTLDAGKITEFLDKLKNAFGEYDSSANEDETYYQAVTQDGAVNELQKVSLSWGDFDLAFGRAKVNAGLFGRMDYGMMSAVNAKLENGDYGLMPGQAENAFVPAMILGISSKAAQPETAEEFVKYLFSEEAQKISQFGGFPVEKEAFRSVIDGHEYAGKDGLVGVGGGENPDEVLDYELIPTPEKEIQKLTSLVESVKTPALQDDVIKEAVVEQGAKVLTGELSPEEGTEAIMQKVNIYLAE